MYLKVLLFSLVVLSAVRGIPMRTSVRQEEFPTITEEGCLNLPQLICVLTPTQGSQTRGQVIFAPTWTLAEEGSDMSTCYTQVTATVSNLTPPGEHGFHVHTYGDLSSGDGDSAGGHFTNPAGEDIPHGSPDDEARHWGDFGNLTADAAGNADYSRIDKVIRLGGIVGRSMIIHAESDKGAAEQPSGDSGSRVAQCVIGYRNDEQQ